MADAVPVHSEPKQPKVAPKKSEPKNTDVPVVEGQDHPELGVWVEAAKSWRKDN